MRACTDPLQIHRRDERAKVVLETLEKGEREGPGRQRTLIDDLPLFRAAPANLPAKASELEARLKDVEPDALTPIDALRLIYDLKGLLKGSG